VKARTRSRIGVSVGLVAAMAAGAAVRASEAQAASAGTGSGCRTVHVGPARSAAMARSSYFQLRIAPRHSRRQGMIVANPQPHACKVRLLPAYGQTAINSGDTYPTAEPQRRCAETSCWLSRLPITLTVPARSRRTVPFVISVPGRTRPGQYLAGVVAQPSSPARAPQRGAGFAAAVIARVAIGVAVTVPGRLRPRLTIPTVTLDTSGTTPLLRVVVRNPGNTWEHPIGGAHIHEGQKVRSFGVRSGTVLPGDSATLALPVSGISRGSRPTEVVLWYDHRHEKAVWRGRLGYPTPAEAGGAGARGEVVAAAPGVPTWAKLVIAALAVLVLGLALLLALLLYRRRRGDEDVPAEDPVAALIPDQRDACAERRA
jgi:hypothetical protein